MRGLRTVALAFAAAGLLALAVGTGGFSAATAERGVQVAVVDDSEAYLGLAEGCAGGNATLTVENRFATDLDDVVVAREANGSERSASFALGSGGSETVILNGTSAGDAVVVAATGDGVHVETTRTVGDDCEAA